MVLNLEVKADTRYCRVFQQNFLEGWRIFSEFSQITWAIDNYKFYRLTTRGTRLLVILENTRSNTPLVLSISPTTVGKSGKLRNY